MTMALGRRRDEQQEMWVATTSLPKSVGHVFCRKLNGLLAEAGFDRMAEKMCEPYYHANLGRPSIPPGVYFRMLLIGYYEGIGSQRGIAWRCSDSLSLQEFLGIPLTKETPDHSSLTRVRDRLPLEVHTAVFQWVLSLAAEKGLLPGKTVAVDATTLEADAAMKSIVRRDTGEDWKEYLRRLLKEEQGIENPTDEELRRFDKQRKDKRVSSRSGDRSYRLAPHCASASASSMAFSVSSTDARTNSCTCPRSSFSSTRTISRKSPSLDSSATLVIAVLQFW
jgi:transposase